MKICSSCGVELEEEMLTCPLCKDPEIFSQQGIDAAGSRNDYFGKEKLLSDYVKLTKNQKRKLFWELSVIILFSGMLVTLIIDLISSKGITWSKYTITVCLVLVVNSTLFSFWRNRLLLLLVGSFLSTSLLLVLLDLYNQHMGWGTHLGIPILFSVYLIFLLLSLLYRKARLHGFNILACFFLALGCISICIESILSQYITGQISLHWSLITSVCMLPIAAILFYIHYRLKRGLELKRFFHI